MASEDSQKETTVIQPRRYKSPGLTKSEYMRLMMLSRLVLKRKQETTVPFNGLPDFLRRRIFQKFTFQQFGVFEECSKSSLALCQSQRALKFPVLLDTVVSETTISRGYFRHQVVQTEDIYVKKKNVKFRLPEVIPAQAWLLPKTLYIKGKLSITQIEFIKANVKMGTSIILEEQKEFPYEALSHLIHSTVKQVSIKDAYLMKNALPLHYGNVENVRIEKAHNISPSEMFSISAIFSVRLTDVNLTASGLLNQIESWRCSDISLKHFLLLVLQNPNFFQQFKKEIVRRKSDFVCWHPKDDKSCTIAKAKKTSGELVVSFYNHPDETYIGFSDKHKY